MEERVSYGPLAPRGGWSTTQEQVFGNGGIKAR